MKKNSLVRTIYLYLFTLVGLALLTIGMVRFVNMGLKAFVFKQADQDRTIYEKQPPMPYSLERVEELKGDEELTEEQKQAVANWLEDYKKWQENSEKVNYVTSQRHRDASMNLSLILIGLPLYLYHWTIIKRETRNKED